MPAHLSQAHLYHLNLPSRLTLPDHNRPLPKQGALANQSRPALQMGPPNYPEGAHKVLIVNAPRLIGAIWSIFAPLLPAATRAKVRSRNCAPAKDMMHAQATMGHAYGTMGHVHAAEYILFQHGVCVHASRALCQPPAAGWLGGSVRGVNARGMVRCAPARSTCLPRCASMRAAPACTWPWG